jgi:hypothetical protein
MKTAAQIIHPLSKRVQLVGNLSQLRMGALKLRLERWLGIFRKIRMKSGAAIERG